MSPRVVIKPDPLNAEAPTAALVAAVIPSDLHYVRSNFDTPRFAASDWALQVELREGVPRRFDLAALRAMPQHEHVVTMECAGNDRLGLRPVPAGEPWASGAVSTARWGGVRLADVVAAALGDGATGSDALAPDVCELVITGADHGPRSDAVAPGDVTFARSLPAAVALHPDTLLALSMNGEALRPEHGAPVRLVVPGWYGMANVKWVVGIRAVTTPFDGYFQRRRYVYDEPGAISPVARMRVKSVITEPADGSSHPLGPLEVRGWAWSGDGPVTRVDVALEGGSDWHEATLGTPEGPHAWTPWSFRWSSPPAGRLVLRSRATDASGGVQPDVITWNRLGYGNNAIRQVTVQLLPAG